MTTTVDEDTRAALFRAVAADPDDDNPRLALRDYLDERDDPRAEFIRVQQRIAEARRLCSCGGCVAARGGGQHTNGGCAVDARQDDGVRLRHRERELLAQHEGEWRRIGCPAAGGGGLNRAGDARAKSPWEHKVHWRRGHVSAVECRLDEVLEQRYARTDWTDPASEYATGLWVPTAWALRVCEWHPVEEFRVSDRQPLQWELSGGRGGRFSWIDASQTEGASALPGPLLVSLEDELQEIEAYGKRYSSREAAVTALARAVARFVRSHLPPESPRNG